MIIKNRFPVCEYDTSRNPIIKPTDFLEKTLPSKCVITFFRKELNQFVEEKNLPVIGYLHSEVLDIPIYEYNISKERICITMPFSTAPETTCQGLFHHFLSKSGVSLISFRKSRLILSSIVSPADSLKCNLTT